MKPLLHPSSIFIFWLTLFIISINIQTPLCADGDSKYYMNCDEAFACDGNSVGNLKYPFRGGNRPDYCGQSELELTCSQDGAAKITINSITYRVVEWEDSTQKLTVARDDFWGGVCAVSDYQNSSLDNSPFQYDYSGDGNVTLLYNCGSIDLPNGFYSSFCDGGGVVYYVVGVRPLSFSSACTSVVVPVLASQVSALASTARNIDEALKEGFGLRWTGNYQECRGCAESGGACGFDGEFRCFCTDGPHTSTCSSDTASAPDKRRGSTTRNIVIGVAASCVGGLVAIISIAIYIRRKFKSLSGQTMISRKRSTFVEHDVEAFMQSYGSLAPRRYSQGRMYVG